MSEKNLKKQENISFLNKNNSTHKLAYSREIKINFNISFLTVKIYRFLGGAAVR